MRFLEWKRAWDYRGIRGKNFWLVEIFGDSGKFLICIGRIMNYNRESFLTNSNWLDLLSVT